MQRASFVIQENRTSDKAGRCQRLEERCPGFLKDLTFARCPLSSDSNTLTASLISFARLLERITVTPLARAV